MYLWKLCILKILRPLIKKIASDWSVFFFFRKYLGCVLSRNGFLCRSASKTIRTWIIFPNQAYMLVSGQTNLLNNVSCNQDNNNVLCIRMYVDIDVFDSVTLSAPIQCDTQYSVSKVVNTCATQSVKFKVNWIIESFDITTYLRFWILLSSETHNRKSFLQPDLF